MADLLIPVTHLEAVSKPELAVTDGSGHPEWVSVPCLSRWKYTRVPVVEIPLDPGTAAVARKWLSFRRFDRRVITPAVIAALVIEAIILLFKGHLGGASYVVAGLLLAVVVTVVIARAGAERKLFRESYPRLAGADVRIGRVPVDVCSEWVSRNPEAAIAVVPRNGERAAG